MPREYVETVLESLPGGWFYSSADGKARGPYPESEMADMVGRGVVRPDDKVWRCGLDGWHEACHHFTAPQRRDAWRPLAPAAVACGLASAALSVFAVIVFPAVFGLAALTLCLGVLTLGLVVAAAQR